MKRDMGFLAPYTIEPQYGDFTKPVIMEGYHNDMGNIFEDFFEATWEKAQPKLEEKGGEILAKALDKYGQPIADQALVLADKYLTATPEQREKAKQNLQTVAQSGTQSVLDSSIQWVKDNKWIVVGSFAGILLVFGTLGYVITSTAVASKVKR